MIASFTSRVKTFSNMASHQTHAQKRSNSRLYVLSVVKEVRGLQIGQKTLLVTYPTFANHVHQFHK